MKHYLGIDIGGTAVKLGIVDEAGRVLAKAEESVSFDGYRTPILTTVLKAAQAFLAAQSVPAESLAGIGVSATGQIDSRKGIVAGTCGSLPNYIGAPIKAELEKTFGLPVTVANDANCMTLGEVWVGAAQGCTDVIGVTLGTGVGGGILTGGRLLEGARGLGGELGHYRTHALDGVDCTCGAKGCWERYAATTALVRAVTAVPGHACFGVFMGVWYGLAKRLHGQGRDGASKLCRVLALLLPALLHGCYDFIASIESVHYGWLFAAFVAILFVLAFILVRRQARHDRYINNYDAEYL